MKYSEKKCQFYASAAFQNCTHTTTEQMVKTETTGALEEYFECLHFQYQIQLDNLR